VRDGRASGIIIAWFVVVVLAESETCSRKIGLKINASPFWDSEMKLIKESWISHSLQRRAEPVSSRIITTTPSVSRSKGYALRGSFIPRTRPGLLLVLYFALFIFSAE